jgi:hypothetical protein
MRAQLRADAMLAAAPIPGKLVFRGLLAHGPHRGVATRAAPASLIQQTAHNLASKKASAVEMVSQYLQQLERREPSVNSFITVDREGALAQVGCLLRPCGPAGWLRAGCVAAC